MAMLQASTTARQSVVITIEHEGACYNASTNDAGMVNVLLPAGVYNASVDHSTVITEWSQQRFVRFTGNLEFTLAAYHRAFEIRTTMSYENATVSGNVMANGAPVSALIEFQAVSATAEDLTVNATGNYVVKLAPGNYTVYAVSQVSMSRAYLGQLVISDVSDVTYDIGMAEAFRLSGVTFANDVGVSAQIVVSGAGALSTVSDPDGSYELYLPGGDYELMADTEIAEYGVGVKYRASASVTLYDVTSKGIVMQRVAEQDVAISWDIAQKVTLNAGDTATYTIRVVNEGNVEDTFRLTSSATDWTVVLSQSEVTLGFGTSNSQIVTVQLTPSESVLVKHNAVVIRAVSVTNSSVAASVSLDAVIAPARAVSLVYQGAESTDGTEYKHAIKVNNPGNVDDAYSVSIGNLQALRDLGWDVRLVNDTALVDSMTVTVSASKSSEVEVSMVPVRANPSPTVTVQLVAESAADAAVRASLDMQPELIGLGVSGLSVTGVDVSDSMPSLSDGSIMLVGVALSLMAVLLVISVQKGVLLRRKR